MPFVAVVEVVVGVGILGMWTLLLAARRVPEIAEGDRAIWFHLAAESLLGVALVAGGSLLLVVGDEPWARVAAGVAAGAMVYSTVNSAGYYARYRNRRAIAGFAGLTVVGIALAVMLIVG
ncbi:MAG: hypothetical protein WBM50_06195 [Acidimicrobiales bacterium]